ncbi:MAG: hypothetical protein ACRD1T_19405, partial [Acidimicrobiia bacterium]
FMTFWGEYRGARLSGAEATEPEHKGHDLISDYTPLHPEDAPKAPADAHLAGHAVHPHESPWSMTGILAVLAILSILGGYIGIPLGAFNRHQENWFQRWLEPTLPGIGDHPYHFAHMAWWLEWALMAVSVAVAGFGFWIAYRFYLRDLSWSRPRAIAARFPWLYRLIENKYYIDEIYYHSVVGGTIVLAEVLTWIDIHIVDGLVNLTRHLTVIFFGHGSSLFDQYVVDGAVNGGAGLAQRSSTLLRRLQTGFVQNYALVMGAGLILLAAVYLITKP